MSRLNHDRPIFKVIDARGGERIRTIAEDLHAAQAADRRDNRRPRCGGCKTTERVLFPDRRCRACLADQTLISKAKKQLRALSLGTAPSSASGAGSKLRKSIAAAEARIAERRRVNAGRGAVTAQPGSDRGKSAPRRPNLQAAERAAEAARKELLLARTEWEKQILRERYRKAQEAVTRAQRLERQRRSLK